MAASFLTPGNMYDEFEFGGSSSDEDSAPIGRHGRHAVAVSAGYSLGGAPAPGAPAGASAPRGAGASLLAHYSSTPSGASASGGGLGSLAAAGVHGADSDSEEEAAGFAVFDRSVAAHTGVTEAALPGAPHRARSSSDASDAADSTSSGAGHGSLRQLFMRPVAPGAPPMQFYLLRDKGTLGLGAPTWSLFLEAGDTFLASSRKRSGQRSSNYLMSLDRDPGDRRSPLVAGKVRANVVGSMYIVYDQGLSPAKAVTVSSRRRELAAVAFDYDRMGPGRMTAFLPPVTGTHAEEHRPAGEEDSLAAVAEGRGPLVGRALTLHNKKPQWDEKLKGHVLNFRGRVTQASVKNFQLACDATGDATVLQFGRVGKHRFTMDVAWPLSPAQAFGVVLASLDPKIADTKSYDALKRQMAGKDAGASGGDGGDSSEEEGKEGAAAGGGAWGMVSGLFASTGGTAGHK